MQANIAIDPDELRELCEKWLVAELSLFGSVLRDDFSVESDIDLLVVFRPEAKWDLWHFAEMREELERFFHRPVDLVEEESLKTRSARKRSCAPSHPFMNSSKTDVVLLWDILEGL